MDTKDFIICVALSVCTTLLILGIFLKMCWPKRDPAQAEKDRKQRIEDAADQMAEIIQTKWHKFMAEEKENS